MEPEDFEIGTFKIPNKLKEDLTIDSGGLNYEFEKHPNKFAEYATWHELASDYESRLKEELARAYARLDHHHRQQAKSAEVKLTEKMVENTVITDPQYVALQTQYLEAQKQTALLRVAKDAMIHRRDMLIQLGANYRAENSRIG